MLPTCKTPRAVMVMAHELARRCLPSHRSKFSRHDFTEAQLFACLCVRELLGTSYRNTEAILRESGWGGSIGMNKVPDHNTLCRAFGRLTRGSIMNRLLDLQANWFVQLGWLGPVCGIDSTYFERWHASRYYEHRCRHNSDTSRHGSTSRPRTSASVRAMPKLGIGVDTASGVILSALASTGMGSDAPSFDGLLFHAWRRHTCRTVVADAGYDSEKNHAIARGDMNVASIIPATVGRRWKGRRRRTTGKYRLAMQKKFARDGGGVTYRQRAKVETVNSMIKRNLGSHLRSRSPRRREQEMLLRVVVHNVMILWRRYRGLRLSPRDPISAPAVGGTNAVGHSSFHF
ncbi:MAG: transposase [Planctomycetota bacterium]